MTDCVKIPVIAIDGTSASGRSTIAKRVAETLGFNYLDSEAIYRVIALYHDWPGVARGSISECAFAVRAGLSVVGDRFILFGKDVTDLIHTPVIDAWVLMVAKIKAVRGAVRDIQLNMRKAPGLVAEGRDICWIFRDTEHMWFVDAPLEVRARRRFVDGRTNDGELLDYETILASLRQCDKMDRNPLENPLCIHSRAQLVQNVGDIDVLVSRIVNRFNVLNYQQ